MPCVISSPSTDSGKTTLSLLISCWAFSKGIKIQTFKVGPDYLDQQQLSSIGQPTCRNLDIFLSGEEWVQKNFLKHSLKYEFSLIEGAMGLFDGLGSTSYSSTANVSKLLDAQIIFVINARGQVASLLPIFKGFRDFDKRLLIKGIIFNNVNSERHKKLIREVFKNENIEILGFLPSDSKIAVKKHNLGLISPMDSEKKIDVDYFAGFAEKNLDMVSLIKFLKSPQKKIIINNSISKEYKIDKNKPIAIAEDKIFHFQYPETKEFFNEIGIPLISWSIFNNEEIPHEASSLIIPGGFPEKYASHISDSEKSLQSLREFRKKGFIYAECGGMMILGNLIKDENGKSYKMSGILPFQSKKSNLSVGYRYIKGLKNTPIIKQNQSIKGHEFHYWEVDYSPKLDLQKTSYQNQLSSPWKIKSWKTEFKNEGWSDEKLHASWVHLHLPSCPEVARNFVDATQVDYSQVS